jgi:PPM family protein phosphatase
MRAVVAAGTDIGHVRDGNEDSYLVQDPLFAVADGMGGHRGGEVASSLALETIETLFTRREGTLAQQVEEANRAVFEKSLLDRSVAGMGTTVTAAMLEGTRIRLAHVGDSRAYLFREGRLRQLTEDHTLVHRMVLEGELTPEEAEVHPHRSILTRALGTEPEVRVDEDAIGVQPGDRLLLCTDGLTGMVPDRAIVQILADETDPKDAVDRLIDDANRAGGIDNITAVVVDIHEGDGTSGTAVEEATAEASPVPETSDPAPPPERKGSGRGARIAAYAGVLISVVVLGFVGLRVYVDTQWYVGVSDGQVVIYRGIPASAGGFDLHHVVVETAIPADAAQSLPLYRELPDGITADDRAEAEAIVEQIRQDVADLQASPTP